MKKSVLIFLLVFMAYWSYGKRQLNEAELRNCKLEYNTADVRIGSSFDVNLINPFTTDSSRKNVGFSSLNLEVTGPAKVVWQLNSLRLKVIPDTSSTPYIVIRILNDEGSVIRRDHIPVTYDQEYRFYYEAKGGRNGRLGEYYWQCNVRHDHEVPLHDSDYCKLDYHMDQKSHGGKGKDGMDLSLYVRMVSDGLSSRLMEIKIVDEKGNTHIRYITPHFGKIYIETVGGFGGRGGRCEPEYPKDWGPNATYNELPKRIHKGQNGNGGDGGKGGDITVYITQEARMFYDHIFLDNPGGLGGYPYDLGYGYEGSSGQMGDVLIIDWIPGSNE